MEELDEKIDGLTMSAEVSAENDSDEMSFEDLGLDEITLKAIEKKGFKVPSPIQVLAIPRLLNGDANVIARARTGTGKTAAFGLPLVQTLREPSDHVRAIILEPTRELAMQTAAEMASFTTGKCPRVAVVYGGASMGEQMRALRKGVEIVVGTPGRVMDLMDRGVLDISKIDYFILDEGDEMLDMGFVDDIENIFESANQDCRVLLFSATIPKEILRIAQRFMGDYEIVEEEGVVEEPLLIDQKYWVLRESEKIEALVRLIDISPDFFGLVFVQRKCDADYVSKALDEKGYEAAALHGDIPQGQREKILARFRAKKTRILVATDVAARGIDIEGLTHVVNYELPFDGQTYVHRIGRTGRAGSSGVAVTFVKPEDTRRKLNYLINAVRKSAKGEMTEGTVPGVEEVLEAKRGRLFDDIKTKIGLNNVASPAVSDDDEIIPMEGEESETAAEERVPHLRKGDAIFDTLAEELCNGQDAKEVVASLLAATYGSVLSRNRYGKITTAGGRKDKNGRGDRGGRDVGYEQIRIYAQMGWDDGFNPRKIADFFHDLLGVPGRKVDAIDMADNFCLLSLPADDARRAIELSEKDKSLPHMHVDTKVSIGGGDEGGSRRGRGRGDRGGRRDGGFGRDRDGGRFGRDRGGRDRDRGFGRDRDGGRFGRDRDRDRSRGGSHSRPNVHTATQRSGSASFFKKSSGATEY
ncbi:MAG: DEAD/DEAH box helicase [Treponema sp.]|nr:DEAD/DEAH box helicase [Candidatus Treponema equi]